MGFFGSDTKQEAKIIINFCTYATDGHMLLISTNPVKDKMQHRRHIVQASPRDYNESAKDYDMKIKQEYYIPVSEGYLLENSGWSEYKNVLVCLPNRIEDIPRGLDPLLKDAMVFIILKRYTELTVIKMMNEGIKDRDQMLREILTLEFAKDYKENIDRWIDDGMKRVGGVRNEPPKPTEQEQR